jgi:hypothetical protein
MICFNGNTHFKDSIFIFLASSVQGCFVLSHSSFPDFERYLVCFY